MVIVLQTTIAGLINFEACPPKSCIQFRCVTCSSACKHPQTAATCQCKLTIQDAKPPNSSPHHEGAGPPASAPSSQTVATSKLQIISMENVSEPFMRPSEKVVREHIGDRRVARRAPAFSLALTSTPRPQWQQHLGSPGHANRSGSSLATPMDSVYRVTISFTTSYTISYA